MNEVVDIKGKLYTIVRTIAEEQVNGNIEGLKAWIDQLHCDRSFKNNGQYYIVRDIADIEFETL